MLKRYLLAISDHNQVKHEVSREEKVKKIDKAIKRLGSKLPEVAIIKNKEAVVLNH